MQSSTLLKVTNFVRVTSISALVNCEGIPMIPGLRGFTSFLKSSKSIVTTNRFFLMATW